MTILIIYDSVFGNTMKVAKVIKESLKANEINIFRPREIKKEFVENADVIIVGSPTRAFSPTKNIKQFLKRLPSKSLSGKKALVFDTRASIEQVDSKLLSALVKVYGYAGETIFKLLEKKGAKVIAEPEGFYVKNNEGPLFPGELERAAKWAKELL
jgi:flavodoxin